MPATVPQTTVALSPGMEPGEFLASASSFGEKAKIAEGPLEPFVTKAFEESGYKNTASSKIRRARRLLRDAAGKKPAALMAAAVKAGEILAEALMVIAKEAWTAQQGVALVAEMRAKEAAEKKAAHALEIASCEAIEKDLRADVSVFSDQVYRGNAVARHAEDCVEALMHNLPTTAAALNLAAALEEHRRGTREIEERWRKKAVKSINASPSNSYKG